ncbi:MAG: hypothetical protein PUJ60_01990 [bacterium]|nr:hypothetical protein [bacterium]MDY4108922.1 hypothetical protein [Bacilli bacterium]
MNKELSTAEKSRKTKLSKKSVEELVNIILRKDDVERRKDNLIKALKINVQGLEKKVEAISNNITNIETEYNDLQKRNFEVAKDREDFKFEAKSLKSQLVDSETQINELHNAIKKASNSAIKMFALGGIIGFLVAEIVAHLF